MSTHSTPLKTAKARCTFSLTRWYTLSLLHTEYTSEYNRNMIHSLHKQCNTHSYNSTELHSEIVELVATQQNMTHFQIT